MPSVFFSKTVNYQKSFDITNLTRLSKSDAERLSASNIHTGSVGLLPCRGDSSTSAAPESYRYLTSLIQQMQTMSAQSSISYHGAAGQGR